jgi:L-fucose mutarotase
VLINIDPLITPELLFALADMGHDDAVAVVDANFTSRKLANGRPIIRMPGLSLLRVSQAILSVLPLDSDLKHPISHMKVCHTPEGFRNEAQQELIDHLLSKGYKDSQIEAIERFDFYDRFADAQVIVQTGDLRPYANFMFYKGLVTSFVQQ